MGSVSDNIEKNGGAPTLAASPEPMSLDTSNLVTGAFSDPSTPKKKRPLDDPSSPGAEKPKRIRLVPGSPEFIQKQQEKAKKAEEKALKLAEKEAEKKRKEEEKKKREEEKRTKEQEKKEKAAQREEEKKAKEAEKLAKQEEKKAKEAEKLAKQGEKKAKQEGRIAKKQEEDRKQTKLSFFISPVKPAPKAQVTATLFLKPAFYDDPAYVVAPVRRITSFSTEDIDRKLSAGESDLSVMLAEFKSKSGHKRRIKSKVVVANDVEEIPAQNPDMIRVKMKMFKFAENRRPPYYGTFSKKSAKIRGRKPLVQDGSVLDYEFDSDDEWEEEPEGEDINHSEDEKEENEEEEDEERDEWEVPDGYLSEGEGIDADPDKESTTKSGEGGEDKKKLLRDIAKNAANQKNHALKAVIIGIYYNLSSDHEAFSKLQKFQMEKITEGVIDPEEKRTFHSDSLSSPSKSGGGKGSRQKPIPDQVLADILKLVNGNTKGVKPMAKDFLEANPTVSISMLQLQSTIKASADKEGRHWKVKPELLQLHGISEFVVPKESIFQKVVSSPKKESSETNDVNNKRPSIANSLPSYNAARQLFFNSLSPSSSPTTKQETPTSRRDDPMQVDSVGSQPSIQTLQNSSLVKTSPPQVSPSKEAPLHAQAKITASVTASQNSGESPSSSLPSNHVHLLAPRKKVPSSTTSSSVS